VPHELQTRCSFAPMSYGLQNVRFPVLAFSPAGWSKAACDEEELIDASPRDTLEDWQGLEVYDSAGLVHRATRAFRAWPRSTFGLLICRLVGQVIFVGFEFERAEPVPLEVLVARAKADGEISGDEVWQSHEEVLRTISC
jgi:hypothetical protein